jgi:cell wall-associated NlpC family hydrolase
MLTCAALVVFMAPTAQAEPSDAGLDRPVPTERDVERAETRAGAAGVRVAEIQSQLALANQQLEAAGVRAEQASEAYNGARWQVEQAVAALRQARSDARRADRQVLAQRGKLAGVVAAAYQNGGDVSAVNALLGATGPEGVMSQMLAYEGASTSLEAQIQEFTATATLADVFRAEARQVQARRVELLGAAEEARDAAVGAAEAAGQASAELAVTRAGLVRELAQLEGVSVRLAERRQRALEEIEQQRVAREAAEAAADAADDAEAAAEQAGQQPSDPPATPSAPTTPSTPTQPIQPPPPSQPADPPPVSAPPASGGAARAIAFARAQLGEPYVWGAAGPSSWDCSGLTMMAWQAAGVSLPHYSVAQYEATTPVAASQLRPGDLVFWGSSGSPGSIYHVALYLGDGMIIHAPRTGRPVTIDSMYYWVPPTFFGRV